ncbi:MAG: type II toxin-antitoxin system RelE/ParE family toxin [Nanoarchaeota archaeon]|nr:type II toxin-antitoxin system RelE/ParE family toxin [Nanoarchaeota archaeon]
MMFEIKWEEKALSELNKFDSLVSRRIFKKVEELKENPFSKDVKKLKGQDSYRLRVGDYRVLFDVQEKFIIVLKVGHRKNIYKK